MTPSNFFTATFTLLTAASLLSAGPLNPPAGPIAPSHKTLTELEPRIPINSTNTPGDADSLYTITQPGSYYLTGSITGVSGKNGIEIASDNVSIDLNGFSLQGVTGSMDGIRLSAVHTIITVKNGSVGGWTNGVRLTFSNGGEGVQISNVIASGNRTAGIVAPAHSVLTNCQALNTLNVGSVGINVGLRSTLQTCTATGGNGHGIVTGDSCTITSCVGSGNANTGINLGDACVITACTANNNGGIGIRPLDFCVVNACTADQNANWGISAGLSCTVSACTATNNTFDGIRVASSCIVDANVCNSNGAGAGDGAGILATGVRNRIQNNQCTNNDRGIEVDASNNFITRNTCGLNTTNWDVAAGNTILVVPMTLAGAVTGNSGGASAGSTDPNANFTY